MMGDIMTIYVVYAGDLTAAFDSVLMAQAWEALVRIMRPGMCIGIGMVDIHQKG